MTTFPGTTIETSSLTKGGSRQLFDGIFATGGITLSQASLMTGLEPYVIQNWVKRGFLTSPVRRVYSKEQFARIVVINMLRESLQIETICAALRTLNDVNEGNRDKLIENDELYHRFVDTLATQSIDLNDELSVSKATEAAVQDYDEKIAGSRKRLARILRIMLYAHEAVRMRKKADEVVAALY